jgi:hypothetical protein
MSPADGVNRCGETRFELVVRRFAFENPTKEFIPRAREVVGAAGWIL